MKNRIKTTLLALIFALSFSACNHKPNATIKTYIAMDKQPTEGTILKLYIDDEFEGNIPVVKGFDENSNRLENVFSKDLKNGKHKIKLKNANNEVLSVAEISLSVKLRNTNPTGIGPNASYSKSTIITSAYNPDEISPYKFKCIKKGDAVYVILQ